MRIIADPPKERLLCSMWKLQCYAYHLDLSDNIVQNVFQIFFVSLLPMAILSTFSITLSSPSPSFALEKTPLSSGRSRQRRRLRLEDEAIVAAGGEVGVHGRGELVQCSYARCNFVFCWMGSADFFFLWRRTNCGALTKPSNQISHSDTYVHTKVAECSYFKNNFRLMKYGSGINCRRLRIKKLVLVHCVSLNIPSTKKMEPLDCIPVLSTYICDDFLFCC